MIYHSSTITLERQPSIDSYHARDGGADSASLLYDSLAADPCFISYESVLACAIDIDIDRDRSIDRSIDR
jgi:hypothetical protein